MINVENTRLMEHSVERSIKINDVKFRVKSIFSGKVELESAIKNIVIRRMSEHKKAS